MSYPSWASTHSRSINHLPVVSSIARLLLFLHTTAASCRRPHPLYRRRLAKGTPRDKGIFTPHPWRILAGRYTIRGEFTVTVTVNDIAIVLKAQYLARPMVRLLDFLGALLWVAGLLLLVAWAVHAFGGRPQITIPFFEPELRFAISERGYAMSKVSQEGHLILWEVPATAFEPLISLSALITSAIILGRDKLRSWLSTRELQTVQQISPILAKRNRHAMLVKLKTIWIDGFLKKSLANELHIELDFTDYPDGVSLPLPVNTFYQELAHTPQPLPTGTRISIIFDQVGGELLILGAPGSGKTTLVLELLYTLLQRAKRDEMHPIPVVFPISTWAAERKPLKEWLIDQLNIIYDVPKNVGQGWIAENELLPLLDGLDEVGVDHREECLEAINEYRQKEAGLSPIVVTSRIADYEVLIGKLRLRGAVLVRPLSHQQVDSYLVKVGAPLKQIRTTLDSNPEFLELLNTPLMLSIVTQGFQYTSLNLMHVNGSDNDRKKWLWNEYLKHMLSRRESGKVAAAQETGKVLSWLARKLISHEQTVFFIEDMQPEWLPVNQRWLVTRGLAWIVTVFAMTTWGVYISSDVEWSKEAWQNVFSEAMMFVYACLLFFAFAYSSRIKRTEVVRWHWLGTISYGSALIFLPLLMQVKPPYSSFALFYIALLIGAITQSQRRGEVLRVGDLQIQDVEERRVPNQGIRLSMRNALVFGLGTLSVALVSGYLFRAGNTFSTMAGVIVISLLPTLYFGGRAVLQHFLLRYLLFQNQSLRFFNLSALLDDFVRIGFLQRIGGGYIFIHRLLMEHFAAMTDEDIERIAGEVEKKRGK
jgi:Cdc6-like AAA superfamily ATPase